MSVNVTFDYTEASLQTRHPITEVTVKFNMDDFFTNINSLIDDSRTNVEAGVHSLALHQLKLARAMVLPLTTAQDSRVSDFLSAIDDEIEALED